MLTLSAGNHGDYKFLSCDQEVLLWYYEEDIASKLNLADTLLLDQLEQNLVLTLEEAQSIKAFRVSTYDQNA